MREKLLNDLKPFIKREGIDATLYFILKSDNELKLKLADIEENAQPEILNQFINYIETEIVNNNEKDVVLLSKSDERSNVIYRYDIEEYPEELTLIDKILGNDQQPKFSFKEENLNDLQGFLVLIGNNKYQLVIYKKHYPVSLFKRDSVLCFKVLSRLTRLDEDILKINSAFEFFKLNGQLYIYNLQALEKFFGFYDIIKRKAIKGINIIENANIIDNPDILTELIENISFARLLTKVTSTSPVLGLIPVKSIINFTQVHPSLRNKFKYNTNHTKIHLHSMQSKKLFLKLLNDDYLQSQLTNTYYESFAKDSVN